MVRRKYNLLEYKQLPVNNHIDKYGKGNLIENRLRKAHSVIMDALDYCYDDVIQQHFTITLPVDYSNTYTIEQLYKKFKDQLDRDWRKKDKRRRKLHYIATIEIEKAKHQHIHFMTFTDSNRNRHSGVRRLIIKAWRHALTSIVIKDDAPVELNEFIDGLIEYKRDKKDNLEHYQHLIDKSNKGSIEEAMFWASYLCKNRGGTALDKFKASQLVNKQPLVLN